MDADVTIDREALSALFDAERASMVRMATLMVGSRAIAEEVVQEAFIKVGEHWSTIERPGAYLRTTVARGCASALRRRSTEQRYAPAQATPESSELPSHLVELRAALDQLSERQRVVVVLRYFVDVPDGEIARIIDARPGTVRSIAKRALTALRKELS